MTKEQIDLLIEHGELWTDEHYCQSLKNKSKDPGLTQGNHLIPSNVTIDIEGKIFNLDKKLYAVLDRIFKGNLELISDSLIECFKEMISDKIQYYSSLKEDKIKLFGDLIIQEGKKLEDVTGRVSGIKHVEAMKSFWFFDIAEAGHELICCLKFDVLNGERIETFDFPYKKRLPNFSKLVDLYHRKELEKIYKSHTQIEKIKYLKELIVELDNPDKPGLYPIPGSEIKSSHPDPIENIFCKGMPVEFARDHFNFFTETNSKNGKPFLNTEELEVFIRKAFLGYPSVEKLTFNMVAGESMEVREKFYMFYLEASNPMSGYEQTSYCKEKYIKLLTDNFNGFNFNTVKNNFRIKS